jgi:hypothetical protein
MRRASDADGAFRNYQEAAQKTNNNRIPRNQSSQVFSMWILLYLYSCLYNHIDMSIPKTTDEGPIDIYLSTMTLNK